MTTPIASLHSLTKKEKKSYEKSSSAAATPIMHPVENANLIRYCCSGISCMCAGFITNPIDVVKVRLQLDNQLSGKKSIFADRYYPGFFRGVIVIAKDEGLFNGLFKGVGASMLREGIYGTIRLGSYEKVKGILGVSGPDSQLRMKILAGVITGSIAGLIASPIDLVKIRMQAQGKLKPGEQPRYADPFSALTKIYKNGGVIALWRGACPTVLRAAMVSASQIPAYDQSKNYIKRKQMMEEGVRLHTVSSFIAGFVTAVITSPIDVIKTRTMNEKVISRYCMVYSSTLNSFVKILQSEGVGGFFKGFIPNWTRTGPHTLVTFLVFEQLRSISGLEPV